MAVGDAHGHDGHHVRQDEVQDVVSEEREGGGDLHYLQDNFS